MVKQWLHTIFSPWGKVVMASFMAAISLFMYLPQGTVSAVPTVQLNVLGFGSSSWNIGNIKPGDSGTRAVILHNAGSTPGKVTIWVSNVSTSKSASVDPKFRGAPRLDKNLTIQLTADGLTSNVRMPVIFENFPKSASAPQQITIGTLPPDGYVDLTWQWSLPARTGNEVQGDSLSFDINYMIESTAEAPAKPVSPPPPPNLTAPVRSIQLIVPGAKTVEQLVGKEQLVGGQMSVSSPEAPVGGQTSASVPKTSISITISNNAQVLMPDVAKSQAESSVPLDAIPQKIEATVYTKQEIPLPEGWVQVSQVYEVVGYSYGIAHHVTIDPPAQIVLGYDSTLLPENTEAIALFYYNEEEQKWVQLQEPSGYVAEEGQMAAEVGHFSIFAVLAKGTGGGAGTGPGVPPVGPGIITPPSGTGPSTPTASFTINNLTVNPPEITVGEQSTIDAVVTNNGGIAGEYTATLTLDGKPLSSQTLTLDPGESQAVVFNVSPALPGTYGVEINGLDGKLNVINLPPTLDVKNPSYWWLILLAMAFVLLMTVLFRSGGVLSPVPTTGGRKRVLPFFIVADALKEIVVEPENWSVNVGDTIRFKAIGRYYDGSENDITRKVDWTTRYENIARINEKGLATGYAPGITAVIASWRDKTGSTMLGVNCSILGSDFLEKMKPVAQNIAEEVQSINVSPGSPVIELGEALRFKATASFMDGHAEDVTDRVIWSSTNDFVADIDRNGLATSYSGGVTTIVAVFKGKRGVTTLTIIRRPQPDR